MLNRKEVYCITKTAKGQFWTRIGSAFVNRDGSLNVTLSAMPVNGKLHIRDPKGKEPESQTP